jgi:hypothetical protein
MQSPEIRDPEVDLLWNDIPTQTTRKIMSLLKTNQENGAFSDDYILNYSIDLYSIQDPRSYLTA